MRPMHDPCLLAGRAFGHNCVKMVHFGTVIASPAVKMGTLLVIEDDAIIAELLGSVLEEGGYTATVVPSLERAPNGEYALVMTDLISTDAYDLAAARRWVAAVRDRFPGVPVAVCTAHKVPDGASSIGADAVLLKPFDVDELLGMVERLTGGDGRSR